MNGQAVARSVFGIRQRTCGVPVWRLDIGSAGIGQAAWCPDRARSRAASRDRRIPIVQPLHMADLDHSLERLRRVRQPEYVVFAPHEDVFTEAASPERRTEVLAMLRRVLAHGIGVALTTRGSAREAQGLIDLAREHGEMMSVRVGIFAADPRLEERWERGLAPWTLRLGLAKALLELGVQVDVELGPIIPFVNDDPKRLRDALRAIARAGVRTVAVRWLEDGPGLADQIEHEVAPSAGRLVNGWFQQPGASVGSTQRRIIPMQVRRTRMATIEEAASALGLHLVTCACVGQGAAVACHEAPLHVTTEQLGLSLG